MTGEGTTNTDGEFLDDSTDRNDLRSKVCFGRRLRGLAFGRTAEMVTVVTRPGKHTKSY